MELSVSYGEHITLSHFSSLENLLFFYFSEDFQRKHLFFFHHISSSMHLLPYYKHKSLKKRFWVKWPLSISKIKLRGFLMGSVNIFVFSIFFFSLLLQNSALHMYRVSMAAFVTFPFFSTNKIKIHC